MSKRLAYLGPAGTFTEEAALLYDPRAELIPFPSIPGVAEAVAKSMADEGVVPIENSIEGSVTDTLDVLIDVSGLESRLVIRQELVLPVDLCLMVKPGTQLQEIKAIFSHPQALGQCRRFLERCLPKAGVIPSLSTAAAVTDMLAHPSPAAAIAPKRAAEVYGAQIVARGIQDRSSNVTRFVVLAPRDHPVTGNDKTSLCFSFAEDSPGLLSGVLAEFAQRRINLAKVESRPSKEVLGRYIFLVDLEGHREDPAVKEALEKVKPKTSLLKVFGSYPKYTPAK